MINENLYIVWIESCFITQGYSRSSVLDAQNKNLLFIPNTIVELLNQYNKKSIKTIFKDFTDSEKSILITYIDFLQEKGLIYLAKQNELKLFPDYNFEWDYPADISNAIVDISNEIELKHFEIFEQLDKLNCFHLHIRFCDLFLNEKSLFYLLEYFEKKSFHTITLTLNYHIANTKDFFISLLKKFPKIVNIVIFSSPFDEFIIPEDLFSSLYFTHKQFDKNISCGEINMKFFALRIEHFTESQRHNSCLNRKICIDTDGNIKNCPNMPQSFGNIKDTTLQQAIEKQGFKDLWFIHKDQIDVCKDCEFRYICTDCRGFIKDPENIYSQPAKCGYNPYIAKWQNEDGYVPVEECGVYSKDTGFVPDIEKIAKLDKKIWGKVEL